MLSKIAIFLGGFFFTECLTILILKNKYNKKIKNLKEINEEHVAHIQSFQDRELTTTRELIEINEISDKHHKFFQTKLKLSENKYKKYYARIKYVLKYINKNVPKKTPQIKKDHIDTIVEKLMGSSKRGRKKNAN